MRWNKNTDYTFNESAYVKNEFNVGSKKGDIPALQEKYPYLESHFGIVNRTLKC